MKRILGIALGITIVSLTPAVGNAADKIEMTCGKEINLSIEPTGGTYKMFVDDTEDSELSFCADNRMVFTMKDEISDWSFIGIKEGKTISTTDYRYNGYEEELSCTFKNLHLIKPVLLQNAADITGKFKLMNAKISCLKADVLRQEEEISRLKDKIRR